MNRNKYVYKGNTYYIAQVAEMKNPETREWQECVIYYSAITGKRYVRELKEFMERFKRIEENETP